MYNCDLYIILWDRKIFMHRFVREGAPSVCDPSFYISFSYILIKPDPNLFLTWIRISFYLDMTWNSCGLSLHVTKLLRKIKLVHEKFPITHYFLTPFSPLPTSNLNEIYVKVDPCLIREKPYLEFAWEGWGFVVR